MKTSMYSWKRATKLDLSSRDVSLVMKVRQCVSPLGVRLISSTSDMVICGPSWSVFSAGSGSVFRTSTLAVLHVGGLGLYYRVFGPDTVRRRKQRYAKRPSGSLMWTYSEDGSRRLFYCLFVIKLMFLHLSILGWLHYAVSSVGSSLPLSRGY